MNIEKIKEALKNKELITIEFKKELVQSLNEKNIDEEDFFLAMEGRIDQYDSICKECDGLVEELSFGQNDGNSSCQLCEITPAESYEASAFPIFQIYKNETQDFWSIMSQDFASSI